MEHIKEYLAYSPFVVQTDNNPLTYVLMMPNLDATGHRWVGALASFQFQLRVPEGHQQWCCRCVEPGSHQPQLGDHPISPRGSDCWGHQPE